MKTYTAYFRGDTAWASRDFRAATPEQALARARRFYEQRWLDLDFQPYDASFGAVDEIEIFNSGGDSMAMWQSKDMLLREAAADLLNAAEKVVSRWEKGDLAEAVRELAAAIAKAKGGPS